MRGLRLMSIIVVCEMRREDRTLAFDGATNGSRETGWCPGIGVFFEGYLIMSKIPSKYTGYYQNKDREYTKEYAIAHFEMLAIVVGLWNFREHFKRGETILLRTDNKTVEGVLKNKSSADMFLADAIRWINMFAWENELRFYINYVHTKVNKIPDALSRFEKKKAEDYTASLTKYHPKWVNQVQYPDVDIW